MTDAAAEDAAAESIIAAAEIEGMHEAEEAALHIGN
jgi:hypothetical protein